MFKREGIFSIVGDDDCLGKYTKFRLLVENISEQLVRDKNLWFSMCTSVSDKQYDIMRYKGLGRLVATSFPASTYRTAIYKYLLHDYLCYVESPTKIKDQNLGYGYKDSFNKFLATSNLDVVAKWAGVSTEEAQIKYDSHLECCVEDYPEDTYPYLKLWDSRGERKVTKPRSEINLSAYGTRVIPLFALCKGVDTMYEKGKNNYLKVSFMKDAGVERDICVSFDPNRIRDIYGDTDFFRDGIQAQYNGDFLNNDNINRGYIRVFEIGGSIYDSPTRSINYARITGIKCIEKEDINLSYINIDLSNVISTFKNTVISGKISLPELVDSLNDFEVGTIKEGEIKNLKELDYWVDSQLTRLSTVFLRRLALFMLGNPQWFNGYTGEGVSESEDSEGMNFNENMLSFEL